MCLFSFLSVEKTFSGTRLQVVPGQVVTENDTKLRAGAIKLLQASNDEESHLYHKIAYQNIVSDEVGNKFVDGTGTLGSITHTLDVTHAETEVRHIGFVKVHKAASSTMQNIFFRFGKRRSLTFAFTIHPNYFSRTAKSSLPLVKPSKRSSYDIICNHGVFNKSVYSAILPKDTVYLAIVREPLDLFISSVNYYTQRGYLLDYLARVPGNKLHNLIEKPEIYDKGTFSYTRNVLARDLGFQDTNNTQTVAAKLKELGETLKLVLLVEYFDESLVLMKRYLNWKLGDILYISSNVYKSEGRSVNDLNPADVDKFKDRNNLDYIVYDFFYDKFWKQFNMESDGIYEEVLHFKRVLTKLKTFCNGGMESHEQNSVGALVIDESKWNENTVVTYEECTYMKKAELKFITELRALQGSELRPPRRVQRMVPPNLRRFPRA